MSGIDAQPGVKLKYPWNQYLLPPKEEFTSLWHMHNICSLIQGHGTFCNSELYEDCGCEEVNVDHQIPVLLISEGPRVGLTSPVGYALNA